MKDFMAMFNKHTIIIVLVHADYCGHCQTYKERVWNNLSSGKNGTAAIHYDQLEGTPLANAKIKGYPSVIIVRKKATQTPEESEPLEMDEFEDEENPGQTTNAMPMEHANDPTMMEKILNASKPATLLSRGSTGIIQDTIDNVVESVKSKSTQGQEEATQTAATAAADDLNSSDRTTLELDHNSEQRLLSKNINSKPNKVSLNKRNIFTPIPDPAVDVLDSQNTEENNSMPFSNDKNNSKEFVNEKGELPSQKGVAVGGSLYSSLLAATRVEEPKRRKTRRGGRRNRKRTKRNR